MTATEAGEDRAAMFAEVPPSGFEFGSSLPADAVREPRRVRGMVCPTEHGLVVALAALTVRSMAQTPDLTTAMQLLLSTDEIGDEMGTVADDLWRRRSYDALAGLLLAHVEPGIVRLAVAGERVHASIGVDRRTRSLTGPSAEPDVRTIATTFEEEATVVVSAGSSTPPTTLASDTCATCDELAIKLAGESGDDVHHDDCAVIVVRHSPTSA